jgi:two-component system, NtrC family, sensor kinase
VPASARLAAHGTTLVVPLMRDAEAIGTFNLARDRIEPFSEQEIALANTFADQAVIAIENTRLLTEQREALERQTATAEVLGVINRSPGDLAPVFDAVLERALRLCGAYGGGVFTVHDMSLKYDAFRGMPDAFAALRLNSEFPMSLNAPPHRMMLSGRTVTVVDIATDPWFVANPERQGEATGMGGARSVLNVPFMKDGTAVGGIALFRETPGEWPDRQVALLENFAAQAVIAMENARLLTEQREALERQTAMADLLAVINRNPGDLVPVFDAILEKAHALCGARFGSLTLWDGELLRAAATTGFSDEHDRRVRQPYKPTRAHRRAIDGAAYVQIADVLIDQELLADLAEYPQARPFLTAVGLRTFLIVPLRKDEAFLGFISAFRDEVRLFTQEHIALLQNFAAQAVIAMDNARLLNEIRQRQSELDITFENMGDGVAMFDREQKLAAWNRNFQNILDLPDDTVRVGLPFANYIRGLAAKGEYGPDADADEQIARLTALLGQANRFERSRPNGHVIDIRQNPIPGGGFVVIYADITERKRAEEALRAARDDAETALRDLKLAQANLVQAEKMASLGQLTAGIAHEIKNPLNFVNNFAALSVELLNELKETAAPAFATLANESRADVEDLTETLSANLTKIEEHGKRADGIVRSMLEHSRETSGEWRTVDLNALVEEALNLAWHGARAQDQSFDVTLERDFARGIAPVTLAPGEMTRVLLNLCSNGFYAARKREQAEPGFRSVLRVTTRELGDAVEIHVRDNGVGVPAEIRDKLFQPFFTTKPTGEGTGLGLSITWDIVTKQHGGTIAVDNEPNVFTEFTVTIPRDRKPTDISP